MTPAEKYARDHGVSVRTALRRGAERAGPSPLAPDVVAEIVARADQGEPVAVIGDMMGLNHDTVRGVLRRSDRKADTGWKRVRAAITANPALRALHEEIMHEKVG